MKVSDWCWVFSPYFSPPRDAKPARCSELCRLGWCSWDRLPRDGRASARPMPSCKTNLMLKGFHVRARSRPVTAVKLPNKNAFFPSPASK